MSQRTLIPFHSMLAFTFLAGFALPAGTATNARVSESYGKLPLQFEANRGQTHKDVRFLSRGAGYSLYLTAGEAVLVLSKPNADAKRVALRMSLVGAARTPQVTGLDELPGKANYFIGEDRSKWRTNVPTYAKVRYQNVYPGIDLVYYGNQRQLEYDFVVAPGADPKKIALGFKGADRLEIDAQGELVLRAAAGDIRLHKPVIYQNIDGVRHDIDGGYVRKGANRVAFQVLAYDASRPLVIDPVLSYSTYLGGSTYDQGLGIAVDRDGNAYVTGYTSSTNFPATARAFQATMNGSSVAFVTKLNPIGSALVYSTYLGGTGGASGSGIAVDADRNAYVTGTASADFPTTAGAFQPVSGGSNDGFVTKLDPTGSALVFSTYLGGSGSDQGNGIAVDPAGNAYITGQTQSSNFPTSAGAFQSASGGCSNYYPYQCDAFVAKLNSNGTALVFSTYLGGSSDDHGTGIAVDAGGYAYVTGDTASPNFPTTAGAFQPAPNGLPTAWVTKLDPTGSALVYSTYLGGSGGDYGSGIAVDTAGNAYVAGTTRSSDFPTTPGAFQPALGATATGGTTGMADAFVAKLNPNGSGLVYSTYLGGGSDDFGSGIAVDAGGNAYVTGSTDIWRSPNFPTTPGAFQSSNHGGIGLDGSGTDAFFTQLNSTGSALVYSTFFGGRGSDGGRAIAVDTAGNAYLVGGTSSLDFPTTAGAFQPRFSSGTWYRYPPTEAFVAKFAGIALLVIDKDGIDDKRPPNFFSPDQVNDDVAAIGVRAQLRFFRDQIGQTITLPAGAVGDEGWFALKTIPQSWTQAGGAAGFVGNSAANPEDPAPQGTGPGLGAPDATGDADSLLKNVPNVTPLGATALNNLVGREVCAVVYDHRVGINPDQRTGDLRGANLGTVAFQVVALAPSGDASPSLPNVQVRIRDARTTCRGPFALLSDAEAP